jgi:hypothetical protein
MIPTIRRWTRALWSLLLLTATLPAQAGLHISGSFSGTARAELTPYWAEFVERTPYNDLLPPGSPPTPWPDAYLASAYDGESIYGSFDIRVADDAGGSDWGPASNLDENGLADPSTAWYNNVRSLDPAASGRVGGITDLRFTLKGVTYEMSHMSADVPRDAARIGLTPAATSASGPGQSVVFIQPTVPMSTDPVRLAWLRLSGPPDSLFRGTDPLSLRVDPSSPITFEAGLLLETFGLTVSDIRTTTWNYRFDRNVSAVPEPGTTALLLAGMGVLVGWQRRRLGRGQSAKPQSPSSPS